MTLSLYKNFMSVSGPMLSLLLEKRKRKNKEHPARYVEKKGLATIPRPEGKLIWIHGASVGETMSVLSLIHYLLKQSKDIHILVTSGTVTSSEMMKKSLPERAFHQFLPLDNPKWIKSFLNHWEPNLALWLESELWPNFLSSIKERNIPLVLLNGRMSQKSFKNWRNFPKTAHRILSLFDKILVQRETDSKSFTSLLGMKTTKKVVVTGSIKYAAQPLSFDKKILSTMKDAFGKRPVVLFSSTHEGEEELCLKSYHDLKKDFPDLLAILVPRHPERSGKIIKLLKKNNIKYAQRSHNHIVHNDTDIYLADTIGELGLFYSLSDVSFIGGSLVPIGGHNPIEAAQLNSAIVYGPHVFNFSQIYNDLKKEKAALCCESSKELTTHIHALLKNKKKRCDLSKNASSCIAKKSKTLDLIIKELEEFLSPILNNKRKKRA